MKRGCGWTTNLRRLRALASGDGRNVARDPLLRWMIVLPFALVPLARWGVPALGAALAARYGFDLRPYHPLILSFLVLVMPGLVGMVVAFLLLDQRDDGTLAALRVTPLPFRDYLAYLLLLPSAVAVVAGVFLLETVALVPVSLSVAALAALAAAPIAPVYALFVARFARNKVEGFALVKAVGVVQIPPILAWWVPEPWQFLFGFVPYYWPAKVVWSAATDGPVLGYAALAWGLEGVIVWLLLQRAEHWLPTQ